MSACEGKEAQALRLHLLSEKNFKNVSLRTCFFLFTKFKKRDLKVIQGHKHNPSMNYRGVGQELVLEHSSFNFSAAKTELQQSAQLGSSD